MFMSCKRKRIILFLNLFILLSSKNIWNDFTRFLNCDIHVQRVKKSNFYKFLTEWNRSHSNTGNFETRYVKFEPVLLDYIIEIFITHSLPHIDDFPYRIGRKVI